MNCETYIVTSTSGELSFFPDNFDKAPLCEALRRGNTGDNEIAVLRRGDLVYYVYLRQLLDKPNEVAGLAVALNSIVIDDVAALHTFFQKMMRSMAAKYNIVTYNKTAASYCSCKHTPNPAAAVERLRSLFNSRLGDKGSALGSQHYSGLQGIDTYRVKEDCKVERVFTDEDKYASLTIRQSVEQGNLVVISSDNTDEQKIAQLNAEIDAKNDIIVELQTINENLKQSYQELIQKAEPLQYETQTLKGQAIQELSPKLETLQDGVQAPKRIPKPAKEGTNKSFEDWFISCAIFVGGIVIILFYYGVANGIYLYRSSELEYDSWTDQYYTDYASFFQIDLLFAALLLGVVSGWQKLYRIKLFDGLLSGYIVGSFLIFVGMIDGIFHCVYEEGIMLLFALVLVILGLVIGHKLHVRKELNNHRRK